jgi:hypothetical protein
VCVANVGAYLKANQGTNGLYCITSETVLTSLLGMLRLIIFKQVSSAPNLFLFQSVSIDGAAYFFAVQFCVFILHPV